ncbi:Crp/Fnr family transcriptional regulator [Aurantibacillus circumpalustris]|uniref:Crp/Fnr family transcriptional regulator n=1 Tax=Aurantibacillus circumpalustris TaxID=3036359 RepID=UPI00295AF71D|nr:Crp/Fnr family transcriptional regulator [Aurantibacillus circumpalustris]
MEFNIDKYKLKSQSFFDMLGPNEVQYTKDNIIRKEYKKGQVLFKEDGFSKGIYIVKKGKVKIHNTGGEGKESIIYIYKKSDFFGYRPLVANEPNPVTATAMDNVVVSFIPKEVFESLLNTSNLFAKKLLINVTSEFSVWINKITLFSQYAVKGRVALSLLILSKVYEGDKPANFITINIGRDDLAAYVGTAKETLVRMLRVFKDEGVITSSGTKITVVKPEVLENYLNYF